MNGNRERSFVVFSGGNDRAVLGFLRALRSCGQRAFIVARTNEDRILRTRFRKDVVWVREKPDLTMDVFAHGLRCVRNFADQRTLVVLPSTEYFNTFLLQHRGEIESLGCEIPLVDRTIYRLLTDKRSAADHFATAGFSIPAEMDVSTAAAPLVAKPVSNISDQGLSLYPKLLTSDSDVKSFLAEQKSGDYFLQEFVTGENLYLLLYMPRDGSDALIWSQRNLLQQPNGKSMLMAEPSDLHETTTAAHTLELLRETGFWGLGMIEFIRTPKRQVFIEMNPRVWGPVQLCLDHNQDLLQAFIGEALYGEPLRFAKRLPPGRTSRKKYFWLGGLAETLAAGNRPVWHVSKKSVLALIAATLRCDVYLRTDSWRCFLNELKHALKLALHRESTES